MAQNELTYLSDSSTLRARPLRRAGLGLSDVLTMYAERYNAGQVPQVSLAEWEKGVAESKAALESAGRDLRRKLARRTLRSK